MAHSGGVMMGLSHAHSVLVLCLCRFGSGHNTKEEAYILLVIRIVNSPTKEENE